MSSVAPLIVALLALAAAPAPAVVNVVELGADPTGSSDSSAAFATALERAPGSPIEIQVPPGTYDLAPAPGGGRQPGHSCLEIRRSNVVLRGAGRHLTTLRCHVAGRRDPARSWELPGGAVWRGNGIELVGPSVEHVTVRGLRLTGMSPRDLGRYPVWGVETGQPFPANPTTGEGWDLTNKGVMIGNGTRRDDIVLDDLEIDSFRGELVYYGGDGLGRITIRDSYLHDSIGDAISTGGDLTVVDDEIAFTENAIEDTPLGRTQIVDRNYAHDNKIGFVFANNIAPAAGGAGRVLITGNRLFRNYRGAVWVRGGIQGLLASHNDMADSGLGTSAAVFIASAYGYGPADVTIEGNVIRAETTSLTAVLRVAQDPGYPVRNIRIVGNRTERSAHIRSVSGTTGRAENALYDAASTVFYEGNDFADGGTILQVGGVAFAGSANAVPFYGVSRPNKWSARDDPGDWGFIGVVSTSSMKDVRPTVPLFTFEAPAPGWSTVGSMSAAGIPDGQRALLRAVGGGDRGVHFPPAGPGWRFRRPYWLTSWGHHGTYPMLAVKLSGGTWVEDVPWRGNAVAGSLAYYADIGAIRSPPESSLFWLSSEGADAFAPIIPFFHTAQVDLAPTAARRYDSFSDAPPGELLTVKVNGNATIRESPTVKLAGGASFAPGGKGGVITFVNPAGTSALYEVSRFAF